MKGMKSVVILAALSLMSINSAIAQQSTPKPGDPLIPKGHEPYFKALSSLAKKYPQSAARFRVLDPKPDALQSAHHACCEWTVETRPQCVSLCKE